MQCHTVNWKYLLRPNRKGRKEGGRKQENKGKEGGRENMNRRRKMGAKKSMSTLYDSYIVKALIILTFILVMRVSLVSYFI
jgi:hypothetical protein